MPNLRSPVPLSQQAMQQSTIVHRGFLGRATLLSVAWMLSISIAAVNAAEVVEADLRDGRTLAGRIHSKSDASELWLCSTEPSILALTSIDWRDISRARLNSKSIELDSLKRIACDNSHRRPEKLESPELFPVPKLEHVLSPQVRSLEIDATPKCWITSRAANGIEVRISPRSADGNIVPVNGLVTVRMLARRLISNERLESQSSLGFWNGRSAVRELRTPIDTQPYFEMGRWNERLTKESVSGTGYVLKLRYRQFDPNYDLDNAFDGVVEAKMNATGQSIHYAETSVSLRPFNSLREDLQLYRKDRFLPQEYGAR